MHWTKALLSVALVTKSELGEGGSSVLERRMRARSHVCQKKANMGHPSLKVSAPLPRGNEISVPSLRRTQRQDGSQQRSHVRIRKSLCPRMLANSFYRDSESTDWTDKGIFAASAPCIPAICCAKAQGRRLCVCGRASGCGHPPTPVMMGQLVKIAIPPVGRIASPV
jgi:hypothetical protein